MSDAEAILKAIQTASKPSWVIGIVTTVSGANTVSCKIGGDVVNASGTVITAAPILANIKTLRSYAPTINDVVVVLIDEKAQKFVVLGKIN